ncbi:Na(+)/H(+) antiporter subunit B [Pseudogracilibacillus sp. ICA-222130]|uniref:Na(+)/H(+) antiporter subunit B n=1 Tax=Pseudogracilibacillus sp. ICA-222130 TaxID=3134655 RepID=UPI0030C476A0
MKTNDVILQSVTKVVVFIILTLAIYLFFSGHNAPGGGFVAGLALASSFVLMLLAFDIETVKKGIPVNFRILGAVGAMLVLIDGIGAVVFGKPFLTQGFMAIKIPFFGPIEISTVTFFETGVALTVVGVVITIILSISEDV